MKLVFEAIIVLVVCFTAFYTYTTYWDDFLAIFSTDNEKFLVYVGDVALSVTVADDPEERRQGLSGVAKLNDFEGKLFIFDEAQKHGIWMKDMLIPIDIIWLDDNLTVIHIEENVVPESYPEIYAPNEPARFVLEMGAHFVDTLRLKTGDRLNVPSELLPVDIRENLQE